MARKKEYTDYVTKEVKDCIPKWKRQGQKDDWIARKIGIGRDLLWRWKKEHKDFDDLFKNGQAQLLLELEETLYTRAKGSLIQEKEITNNDGRKTIKIKEKYIWSDKCLEMALKRLAPDKWSEKLQVDVNAETSKVFDDLKRALKKNDK